MLRPGTGLPKMRPKTCLTTDMDCWSFHGLQSRLDGADTRCFGKFCQCASADALPEALAECFQCGLPADEARTAPAVDDRACRAGQPDVDTGDLPRLDVFGQMTGKPLQQPDTNGGSAIVVASPAWDSHPDDVGNLRTQAMPPQRRDKADDSIWMTQTGGGFSQMILAGLRCGQVQSPINANDFSLSLPAHERLTTRARGSFGEPGHSDVSLPLYYKRHHFVIIGCRAYHRRADDSPGHFWHSPWQKSVRTTSPSNIKVYWFDDKNPGSVGSNDVRESMTPEPHTLPGQITDDH